MAPGIFVCKICQAGYNSQCKRPFSLECGHDFCEVCVRRMGGPAHKICPICKKPTTKPVEELLVIFDLIPREESFDAHSSLVAIDKCKKHGFFLDNFCTKCGKMVCRTCIEDSHLEHKTGNIDDILNKSPGAANLAKKLKSKLQANINSLTTYMSMPEEISEVIGELQNCAPDLEKWKDSLRSEKMLVKQLLEAWNDARNITVTEKRELFKKLFRRWKGEDLLPHPSSELASFLEKCEAIGIYANALKKFVRSQDETSDEDEDVSTINLFPTREHWRVQNEDHLLSAVSSLQAGRTTKYLEVMTIPNQPMRQLHEALNFLASSCDVESISLKLFDEFWAPLNKRGTGHLQGFIEKFGHKVFQFYGSPREAVTLCRVNPTDVILSVRIASMDDLDKCAALSRKPICVCCIGGLPVEAGHRMRQLGWAPCLWHFPDSQPGSVDWIISLMEPLKDVDLSRIKLSIFLPRCSLTEKDLDVLLAKYSQCSLKIYCEHILLSDIGKLKLESKAMNASSETVFRWTIPLESA